MSAALLKSVAAARADHDQTCRYGGTAVEVHLNPADAERLQVADGEDLCGLTARHDEKVALGRFRIYCDLELDGARPSASAARSTHTRKRKPTWVDPSTPVEMPLAGWSS